MFGIPGIVIMFGMFGIPCMAGTPPRPNIAGTAGREEKFWVSAAAACCAAASTAGCVPAVAAGAAPAALCAANFVQHQYTSLNAQSNWLVSPNTETGRIAAYVEAKA